MLTIYTEQEMREVAMDEGKDPDEAVEYLNALHINVRGEKYYLETDIDRYINR